MERVTVRFLKELPPSYVGESPIPAGKVITLCPETAKRAVEKGWVEIVLEQGEQNGKSK